LRLSRLKTELTLEKRRTTRTEWISKDEKYERTTAFLTTVVGVVVLRLAAVSTSRRRAREDALNTRVAPHPLGDVDLDRTLVAATADKLIFNLS